MNVSSISVSSMNVSSTVSTRVGPAPFVTALLDPATSPLRGMFDNANMFPPGSAPLESAVALHRSVLAGPFAWLQGRLLLPSSALSGLSDALDVVWPEVTDLRVGVIGDAASSEVVSRVARFADPRVRIDQMELRAPGDPTSTYDVVRHLDVDTIALETPALETTTVAIGEHVSAVRGIREGDERVVGKVRCGGIAAGSVPSAEVLATFLATACRQQLPFKATAGLHHPFAAETPDSTDPRRHGFMNILVATAAAQLGDSVPALVSILNETNPSTLPRFSDEALHHAREFGFLGMGTCSILEPVLDLRN
jgi:hypothetical protein